MLRGITPPTRQGAEPVSTQTIPELATGRLVRTGAAIVTVRNENDQHLTFRLRARAPWTGRDGIERPADGYWMDLKTSYGEWDACGIATEDGQLRPTSRSTGNHTSLYAAHITLALLANARDTNKHQVTLRSRTYTMLLEERCGKCGRELTDPVSIERGLGPECFGKATGSKRAKGTR